jgi:hypothetical protein
MAIHASQKEYEAVLVDPITIILSGLSLAGAALQAVAGLAVKDGYDGLKALILQKFGARHPKLEGSLASGWGARIRAPGRLAVHLTWAGD